MRGTPKKHQFVAVAVAYGIMAASPAWPATIEGVTFADRYQAGATLLVLHNDCEDYLAQIFSLWHLFHGLNENAAPKIERLGNWANPELEKARRKALKRRNANSRRNAPY